MDVKFVSTLPNMVDLQISITHVGVVVVAVIVAETMTGTDADPHEEGLAPEVVLHHAVVRALPALDHL